MPRPLAGLASADTSAVARIVQSVVMPSWYCGCGSIVEHPEPPLSHAVSSQPRETEGSLASVVPPAAVTSGSDDGHSTRFPVSPVETVTATPGCW